MSKNRRPEHIAPPDIFYGLNEASKYTQNSRVMRVQESLSNRAIELLGLDARFGPQLILDIGCGSGLSSQCIEEVGHKWIGIDISDAMIDVARERRKDGDLDDAEIIKGDLGNGLPFKSGSFDAAISVSVLQWLCNADQINHSPAKRLLRLFSTLNTCLTRQGKAVFQFYPENVHQVELINQQALKAGFVGGIVVDYPESTKAKKMFLVLSCGESNFNMPTAMVDEKIWNNNTVQNERRQRNKKTANNFKTREWILNKKERRRKQGEKTRPDTKYTGRKRSCRF